MIEEGKPIFLQIAESIESAILDGSLAEGERAPSTNELAAFHRINPATAAKGLNLLADEGLLEKRRGLGMFVTHNARTKLLEKRRAEFAATHIDPLLARATILGLGIDELIELIRSRAS